MREKDRPHGRGRLRDLDIGVIVLCRLVIQPVRSADNLGGAIFLGEIIQ